MTAPSTTVEHVPPAAATVDPAERRGVLDVAPRAIEHLVAGVVRDKAPQATARSVSVRSSDEQRVEIDLVITLAYPTGPISAELAAVRSSVGDEVTRLLGRSVTRLDLTVADLVSDAPRTRRRVV